MQSQDITQVPLANLSTDSHPSQIFPHGASMAKKTVRSKPKFVEFMCSHNEVFRYVLKATEAVIPNAFWGSQKNFKMVMRRKVIDHVRKYMNLTLPYTLYRCRTIY
ncbi:hypothetical protein K439DRAFT_1331564 [Ramaria rubella]|nr:hypothetical protein K439DRAFT_1331564 [Ramaria rubella]